MYFFLFVNSFIICQSVILTYQVGSYCSSFHVVMGYKHIAPWRCHRLTLSLFPWGHRYMAHSPETNLLTKIKTSRVI